MHVTFPSQSSRHEDFSRLCECVCGGGSTLNGLDSSRTPLPPSSWPQVTCAAVFPFVLLMSLLIKLPEDTTAPCLAASTPPSIPFSFVDTPHLPHLPLPHIPSIPGSGDLMESSVTIGDLFQSLCHRHSPVALLPLSALVSLFPGPRLFFEFSFASTAGALAH